MGQLHLCRQGNLLHYKFVQKDGTERDIPHQNTIGNLLAHRPPAPDKYSLSGVYKLTCPDCNKAYIGQAGRKFATRFQEHKKAFSSHSHNSSFAEHLDEEAHSFGQMHDIMELLHYHRKGAHLNTLERFHIHTEAAKNNHLNEGHTIYPNAIFDTLLKTNHHKNPSQLPNSWQPKRLNIVSTTTRELRSQKTHYKYHAANTESLHTFQISSQLCDILYIK